MTSAGPEHLDGSEPSSEVDAALVAFVRGLPRPRAPARVEPCLDETIAAHLDVVRRIGAGATSVVYLARDTRLQRDVAVKLFTLASDKASRAVEREAHAMARLSHPNVLIVHEVGIRGAGVYIVTEFVDGGTLRRWLAEAPRSHAEIVGVFVQAARGLHAAHLAGLCHRDFKPDNVLVGRDGRVRIADFGLAYSRDTSIADQPVVIGHGRGGETSTNTDRVAGTPAYIAPERVVARDDGPYGDQFALGVSLYEAVCGHRPYAVSEPWTATAADRRAPPADTPRWLRAVMLRAVALDPAARFADVGALADELERGLAGAARRRRFAALAGFVALTVTVGIAIGSQLDPAGAASPVCGDEAVDAVWNPERAAQLAASFARTGSPIAEQAHADVVTRLDAWTSDWRAQRSAACRAMHEHGEDSSDLLDHRVQCLDRRLASVEVVLELLADADREAVTRATDLVAQLPLLEPCTDSDRLLAAVPPPDDAALANEVERARRELARADAQRELGRDADALAIATAVESGAAAGAYVPLHAEALHALGRAHSSARAWGASEAALEQAFHEARAAKHDEIAASAARELVCAVSEVPGGSERARGWVRTATAMRERITAAPRERARLESCRARLHFLAGEFAAAETVLRDAIGVVDPSGVDELALATLHGLLGTTLKEVGRLEEARLELELALSIFRAVHGPIHPTTLHVRSNLASVVGDLGQTGPAAAMQLEILQALIVLHGPDSRALLKAYNNVALALESLDARPQAVAYLERGLAIARMYPDQQRMVAALLGNLARHAMRSGDLDHAVALGREVVAAADAASGPQHVTTAFARVNLGNALGESGRAREARAEYELALAILEPAFGSSSIQVAAVHLNMTSYPGICATDEELARHLDIAEDATGAADDPALQGGIAFARADLSRRHGDRKTARALTARAVELVARVDADHHRRGLLQLALDDLELHDWASALDSLTQARALAEAAHNRRDVASSELAMARAHWSLGDHARARTLATSALATYESLGAAEPGLAEARSWLAHHRG